MKLKNLFLIKKIAFIVLVFLFYGCQSSTNKKIQSSSTKENTNEINSNSEIMQVIKEVKIGKQIWMGENLNVIIFRNGDSIPYAKTNVEWINASINQEPAWCYFKNETEIGTKNGKLYNWYAVNDSRGLAPKGWHIPSYDEWIELISSLGGDFEAGSKIKSKNGWSGNGTNESGFDALQLGFRSPKNGLYNEGLTHFWSSTKHDYPYSFMLSENVYNLLKEESYDGCGFSVRCVKD